MFDLNTTDIVAFFKSVEAHDQAVYSHIWWEDLGYASPDWAFDLKKCGLPEGVLGWAVKQPEADLMRTLRVLQEYCFCVIRGECVFMDSFDYSPIRALEIVRQMMADIREAEIQGSLDQDPL